MTSQVDTSTGATEIYQFKIVLKSTKPPIWRRIQVPNNFTFYDLHVAIEDLFKWSGNHLHKFEMVKPKQKFFPFDGHFELDEYIGIPDRAFANDYNILPEKETRIADQFSILKNKCLYVYDFGSEWRHDITLEQISIALPNVKYPICIKGARQPPPEDGPEDPPEGLEAPFSKDSIIFRDPEEVWRTTAFRSF